MVNRFINNRFIFFIIFLMAIVVAQAQLPLKKYTIQDIAKNNVYQDNLRIIKKWGRGDIPLFLRGSKFEHEYSLIVMTRHNPSYYHTFFEENVMEIIGSYAWRNLLITNVLKYQYCDIYREKEKKINIFSPSRKAFSHRNKKYDAEEHFFNLFSMIPPNGTGYPVKVYKDTSLYLSSGIKGSHYNFVLHYFDLKKWENNPCKMVNSYWGEMLDTNNRKTWYIFFDGVIKHVVGSKLNRRADESEFEHYAVDSFLFKTYEVKTTILSPTEKYDLTPYDKIFYKQEDERRFHKAVWKKIGKYEKMDERASKLSNKDTNTLSRKDRKFLHWYDRLFSDDTNALSKKDKEFLRRRGKDIKEYGRMDSAYYKAPDHPFMNYRVKVAFISGLRLFIYPKYDYPHPSDLVLVFDKDFYNFDFNVAQLYYSIEPYLSFSKPESYIPFFVLLTDTYFGTDGSTFKYTGQKKNQLYFTFYSSKLQKEIELTFKKSKNPVLKFKEKKD